MSIEVSLDSFLLLGDVGRDSVLLVDKLFQ